ncbi:hypothetical protein LUCX_289 [Xanthomonas phage vB_XciM_LucasX]|nr:hypothetical protein LUCX_289 [Xanthomonas phage vB_XciM_LucasX]
MPHFDLFEIPPGWSTLASAPKDGRELLLLVPRGGDHAIDTTKEPYVQTIGHNSCDHDGQDVWHYVGWCADHGHYVSVKTWLTSSGEESEPAVNHLPIAFKPLPPIFSKNGVVLIQDDAAQVG